MRSVRPKWRGGTLWALVSTGACLLALNGCDGGGEAADIAFELALPVDSLACRMGTVMRPEELTGMPCATVRMFEQAESGALTPLPLFAPDGDRMEGQLERRVQLDETRRIQFDVQLPQPEAEHTLVFRVYDGSGEPAFGATVVGRQFGPDQPRLTVRLYPFREPACASTQTPIEGLGRALHEAVSLANGDVVILGGVTGLDLDPASAQNPMEDSGATLEQSILLYDASEHRFERLSGDGLGRVGFAARYMGEEDGRYRIRVVGGYAPLAPSSPLIVFDNSARFAPFGLPFAFTEEPVLQEPVDLLIDVEGASVEIERLVLMPVMVGGLVSVSDPVEAPVVGSSSLVLPGLQLPVDGTLPNTPRRLDNSYFFLTENGTNTPSSASTVGRIGATATGLPGIPGWFVWGGGVGEATSEVRDVAGELITPAGVAQVIAAGSGIPEPTSFHTATRFPDENTIVFVGGYEVRVDRNIGVRPTLTPIVALRFTGATVAPRVIAGCSFEGSTANCEYQNTVLHTATVVPGLGLLITGGATTADELIPASARRFVATESISVVDSALRLSPFEGAALQTRRFGHTATLLPGNRLLIVGGFNHADDTSRLSAVFTPEVIYLDKAPPRVPGTQCFDTSDLDAGSDAGLDAGEFTFDAGPDAGPPDSGVPDGAVPDGGLADGAVPDGGLPDGALPDSGPVDSGV